MTERVPDWEQRLSDCIAANRSRPHEYGQWDCMMMPAAMAEAVTGVDHGEPHRGKYKSAASASRYLQGLGHATPEQFLDAMLDEKPPGFAQRGDIVLCQTESGDNPGVCMGAFALVVGQQGETEGLVDFPRAACVKAWKVG